MVTEHIPSEILMNFLSNNETLNAQYRQTVALHLSYCLICQEQYDELTLKEAVNRMWDAYEQSGELEGHHFDDATFERFWQGTIKDKELLRRISEHCIICRQCRHLRMSVLTRVQ